MTDRHERLDLQISKLKLLQKQRRQRMPCQLKHTKILFQSELSLLSFLLHFIGIELHLSIYATGVNGLLFPVKIKDDIFGY